MRLSTFAYMIVYIQSTFMYIKTNQNILLHIQKVSVEARGFHGQLIPIIHSQT